MSVAGHRLCLGVEVTQDEGVEHFQAPHPQVSPRARLECAQVSVDRGFSFFTQVASDCHGQGEVRSSGRLTCVSYSFLEQEPEEFFTKLLNRLVHLLVSRAGQVMHRHEIEQEHHLSLGNTPKLVSGDSDGQLIVKLGEGVRQPLDTQVFHQARMSSTLIEGETSVFEQDVERLYSVWLGHYSPLSLFPHTPSPVRGG